MKTDNVETKHGSSNEFADLELPDVDTHLLKAAKLLGLSQPDVSHLLRLTTVLGYDGSFVNATSVLSD